MRHDLPNTIGIDREAAEKAISPLVPGYVPMGSSGMAERAMHRRHMEGVENTLPMMTGTGPFGSIEMGGMFTMVKICRGSRLMRIQGGTTTPRAAFLWKVDGDSGSATEHHHLGKP